MMNSSIDRLVSGFVSYSCLPETAVACKPVLTFVHSFYFNSGSFQCSEVITHVGIDAYTFLQVPTSLFGTNEPHSGRCASILPIFAKTTYFCKIDALHRLG